MKNKIRNLSANIFNFRLFLEALKRLRVIGLATAILAVTSSSLLPIFDWIESYRYTFPEDFNIETCLVSVAIPFVTALAPFFLFVLFSFLQKRKESDFFHAIPYTRTCVYVSFVTAALSFVWTIQIACALVSCILWGMVPGAHIIYGEFIPYTLSCLLASAMLSGFMMLALTVSGTPGSCMLLFVLFAGFVRVLAAIFLGMLESIVLLPSGDLWYASYFSPMWLLPLNIFNFLTEPDSSARIMNSLSNVLYSLLSTIALYVLAGVIYLNRKSEMAGSSAPGRKTQTLFRVMFALIPALLMPLLWINGEREFSFHFVLLIVVLLVYFLYELVTTKRAKNMLKAIPSLSFVVIGCAVFVLFFQGYRNVILNRRTEAEDIKSVTIEAGGLHYGSYQSYLLYNLEISDAGTLDMVAKQLAYSQDLEDLGQEWTEGYWSRTKVTIHLKNGMDLHRQIIFSTEDNEQILDVLREVEAVRNVLYRLPTEEEVQNASFRLDLLDVNTDYVNADEWSYLMKIFREEYEGLTQEQKDRVMAPTFRPNEWYESKSDMILNINGRFYDNYYNSEYVVIPEMTRTRAALLIYWANVNYNVLQSGDTEKSGASSFLIGAVTDLLEDGSFTDIHRSVTVNLELRPVGVTEDGNVYSKRMFAMSTENLLELMRLLQERDVAGKKIHNYKNATLTENSYIMHLIIEDEGQTYHRFYLDVAGLFELTPEDVDTMFTLFGIKNPMK